MKQPFLYDSHGYFCVWDFRIDKTRHVINNIEKHENQTLHSYPSDWNTVEDPLIDTFIVSVNALNEKYIEFHFASFPPEMLT